MKHVLCLGGLLAAASPMALADTTIVSDDFESYTIVKPTPGTPPLSRSLNDALYAAWQPRDGSGNNPPAVADNGVLFDSDDFDENDPTLFPGAPTVQGQGVDYIGPPFTTGAALQSTLLGPGTATTSISPSASQSVVLSGDIWVGNDGNSRTSIGLRNRTTVGNLIELGTYNTNTQTTDPTSEDDSTGAFPVTTYAYRLVLFGGIGGDLVREPNWQFFQLDPRLDRPDPADPNDIQPGEDEDTFVDPADIQFLINESAGDPTPLTNWHHYSATITPDSITLEFDLFRDGLDNAESIAQGSDVSGVDATQTWQITTGAQGFDSLRFGGPSGVSTANGVAFDNISLTLVDVAAEILGDYNDNGLVEQGDLNQVLNNWGTDFASVSATWINQRPTEGIVDQAELNVVLNRWGSDSAPDFSGSSVPEPASLALLGLGALALRRRG